jgi:predicted pyridoxine 5'-phosphate oxidase superfamily flavin-nucleotide-binding protein
VGEVVFTGHGAGQVVPAPRAPRTVFHEGELAVQRRAGVADDAARVGRILMSWIPQDYADFLASQMFVVVAGRDAQGLMWASPLTGAPGFACARDDRRLHLASDFPGADPLAAAFDPPGAPAGLLAIEPGTRTRIRVNGLAERAAHEIDVDVREVFGNCRKYIQRREPEHGLGRDEAAAPFAGQLRLGREPDARQSALIASADTFFIASSHPRRGADASHRGGRPGFVELSADARRLRFPDYPGNRMFQTLGNIDSDPRVGLLFVDWETGTVVQLAGRATIVWDQHQIATFPGAERLVDVAIDAVTGRERAMPARWKLVEESRVNPPLRAEGRR